MQNVLFELIKIKIILNFNKNGLLLFYILFQLAY